MAPEEWCLGHGDIENKTFAYLKDTSAQHCYPLTTESLYPSQLNFEDDYNPDELTLVYESETPCPFEPGNKFSITFYFECQEGSLEEKGPSTM